MVPPSGEPTLAGPRPASGHDRAGEREQNRPQSPGHRDGSMVVDDRGGFRKLSHGRNQVFEVRLILSGLTRARTVPSSTTTARSRRWHSVGARIPRVSLW